MSICLTGAPSKLLSPLSIMHFYFPWSGDHDSFKLFIANFILLFSQITYIRSFKFSLDNPIMNPNSRLAFSITWLNYAKVETMKTDVTILLTVGLRCSQTMTFGHILNTSETLQFVSLNPQKIHCFDVCTQKNWIRWEREILRIRRVFIGLKGGQWCCSSGMQMCPMK